MNEFLYEFIERESFNVYIIIVPKLWWHTSALCMKIIFYQILYCIQGYFRPSTLANSLAPSSIRPDTFVFKD